MTPIIIIGLTALVIGVHVGFIIGAVWKDGRQLSAQTPEEPDHV